MKPMLIVVALVCGLLIFEDPALAENTVTISSPLPGDTVGARVVVEGTADISDGSTPWVLVHPRLLAGQWWPQPRPVVDGNGRWQALASIGQAQDIGLEFEISVATFGPAAEALILQYHEEGADSGSWLPISFPPTTSPIATVRVVKGSH